ncbi:MAG: phospholipase D-like domain-containing protein [Chloroflexota bacterium]
MRTLAKDNDVTVKAYAGTTGVLLAMNIEIPKRQGLLGFAIRRLRVSKNRRDWLAGGLHFPGIEHKPGEFASSNVAPIQKFRWSDYTVYPDEDYEYTVHPVYGAPEKPEVTPGATARVRTESLTQGEHRVIFNRAAAASQAFSRRFEGFIQEYEAARKTKLPPPPMPSAALSWLTRGLLDQILNFIGRAADANWALDIAIYEYELSAIIQAVQAARERGAMVRIVFHAKPDDEQTHVNLENLRDFPELFRRARVTHKICHHKFMVLSQKQGGTFEPQAVLCGSTNFTENGVYRQANVVHILESADTACQYAALFEVLFRGDTVGATRKFINKVNLLGDAGAVFAGFSPRTGLLDLKHFIEIVNSARRDVLFCTAFDLYDPLQQALLGQPHDPILRYGMQNTRSRITGVHADRSADFAAAAMLSGGLEGWLKESTVGQRGNILIHTKIVIVDFTSDSPTVISGSHNLSKPASDSNDENYLILRGVPNVADTYGCELMRLYDHYRFRFKLAEDKKKQAEAGTPQPGTEAGQPKPLALCPDDTWTDDYFGMDTLKTFDRLRFAGEPV